MAIFYAYNAMVNPGDMAFKNTVEKFSLGHQEAIGDSCSQVGYKVIGNDEHMISSLGFHSVFLSIWKVRGVS